MKGGGIVALVIFIFLFFCFIWGIASVVGGAREKVQAKSKKIKSFMPHKSEPTSSHSPAPGNFPTKDGADVAMADEKKSMNHILEHLEKLSQLHKDGSLTDEEFSRLKEQLIK
ncbi:SHOCT domain-containing protein [Comamonas nitrativorans]|uniref:SHOCT domain-containing protein n=1 Tax=Comamonas nitrativorans TaxID=108437 RepID=A0ABV9GS79_9BURK